VRTYEPGKMSLNTWWISLRLNTGNRCCYEAFNKDFRLSQRWVWRWLSSGMLHRVVW
jgi:hypothetical protein